MEVFYQRKLSLNLEEWKYFYSQCDKDYQRRRMEAIRLFYEENTIQYISQVLGCTERTLSSWIDMFLVGGLKNLIKPIQKKKSLSESQKEELIQILIKEKPTNYGFKSNEWNVKSIRKFILFKWGIEIKNSSIYQVLRGLKSISEPLNEKFKIPLNLDEWNYFYRECRDEQSRKKLWVIRYICESKKSKEEICYITGCSKKSLYRWLNEYRKGGIINLLKLNTNNKELSLEQKQRIKSLLNKSPVNYGIDEPLWTIKSIQMLINLEMKLELKFSQVCEIINESF